MQLSKSFNEREKMICLDKNLSAVVPKKVEALYWSSFWLGFCFGECIKQNHKVEQRVGIDTHTQQKMRVCCCCKKLCRERRCKKRNTSLSTGLWHCCCVISSLQLCFIQLFGTISQPATTHTLQTVPLLFSALATCLHFSSRCIPYRFFPAETGFF